MTAAPIQPRPLQDEFSPGGSFLRRVFGMPSRVGEETGIVEMFGPPEFPVLGSFRDERLPSILLTSSVTAIHVLWCADESTSTLSVGRGPADLRTFTIAPGETVTLPAGHPWRVSNGVVVFVAEGEGGGPTAIGKPTHGLEVFEGFNRRTFCASTPGLMLERWKITQPCPITVRPDQPLAIVNLLDPIGVAWSGGVDNVDRMDARIMTPALGQFTVFPDGLAYILVTRVPKMTRDVIEPLRAAGFRDAQIASLNTYN